MNADELAMFVTEMECETAAEAANKLHKGVATMTGVLAVCEMMTTLTDHEEIVTLLMDLDEVIRSARGRGRTLHGATSALARPFEAGAQ